MPKATYSRCKDCGASREDVGPLSCTRLCPACSERRLLENVDGIRERQGPAHERRQYGIVRQVLGPRVALALKQAGVFDGALDAIDGEA